MPTLLRAIIVLLSTGVLYAGIAVLAFAEVVGSQDAWRLAVGSLAVTGLVIPPMLAGTFASYWSWDASARRRLRISLTILLAVQVVGAVGMIALTIGRGGLIVAAIVLVAIGAALDPASIALGRAARRADLRRDAPAAGLEEFRARIATGWRRGGIGAAIGLAFGILIGVLLLLPLARGGDSARALLFAPVGAGLGASIGMLTVVVEMARRIRDLLGGDYSSARRIGRAVAGKPEALTPDEEVRASRYAAAAPAWLRLQITQTSVNSLAVAAILVFSLLGLSGDENPGFGWVAGAIVVLLLGTIVAGQIVMRRRVRRITDYATAHPLVD